MNAKDIETSIDSYKARMESSNDKAISAIREGLYSTAAMHIIDAASYKSAIVELEFQLEAMEVEA